MATISYQVCDRCGEKINYRSRKLAEVYSKKIQWIICGAIVERKKQLCGKCSEELEKFLENK